MEDQLTIDTGEISTSPGIALMSQNYADREKFPDTSVPKRQKGFFERVWPLLQAYGASLIASYAIVPTVAAAFTVIFFIIPWNVAGWLPVLLGCIVTVTAWLVFSVPMAPFTSGKTANTHNYGLIENRLSRLETRLYSLQTATPEDQLKPYQRVALEEAYDNLSKLHNLIYSSTSRLPWVLAMGYVNAWNWLHRTEEALIEIEPIEMVVGGAYHDYMAISNSKMDNSKELLCNLSAAAKVLDPHMATVLAANGLDSVEIEALGEIGHGVNTIEQNVQHIATKLGVQLSDSDDQPNKTDNKSSSAPDKEANARLTLREIRQALNEFRDNQRLGIVHTRNQLMASIFVTGLVIYALLCVAILPQAATNGVLQPEQTDILAGVVFFIVGAVSGLFGIIYRQSMANSGGDDYGLSLVRLISTPLISGLAGIGGAFLYSVLFLQVAANKPISLSAIFTLDRLDFLIAAAVFGFAPSLLMKGLQSNKFVSALQSSETSNATNASGQQNGAN